MGNPYSVMMPRMEGSHLEDARFSGYVRLVEKGVAGFILFGGRLETVRGALRELQRFSRTPLIIASDLERGLGQQVAGGSLLPPAMALGQALRNGIDEKILGSLFRALAREALWAGINLVLAPVLDINTNPENPIIATRAFGEDPQVVSRLGRLMVVEVQKHGLLACGKHFPGHGGTGIDSHLALPSIEKTLKELEAFELAPFREAVSAGVSSIMLGHLKLPLIDKSGLPATVSKKAVRILRERLGFGGLAVTDALNMAGLSMGEGQAARLALAAGVDVLLHPSEPDRLAEELAGYKGGLPTGARLMRARRGLAGLRGTTKRPGPDFRAHARLAQKIEAASIAFKGEFEGFFLKKKNKNRKNPAALLLSDEPGKIEVFAGGLRKKFPGIKIVANPGDTLPEGDIIAVVHSVPRAGKPPSERLKANIERLREKKTPGRRVLWVSFGNPYLAGQDEPGVVSISDSASAQRHVAGLLL